MQRLIREKTSEEIQDSRERVLLISVVDSNRKRWRVIQSLDELASLTRTAGGVVIESLMQVRRRFDPETLLGIGKARELAAVSEKLKIDDSVFVILWKGTEKDREIEKLALEREKSRKQKDWKEADRIRDLLKKRGFVLEDTDNGVNIKRAQCN